MGQYNITIKGSGAHGNKSNPGDADKMAAKLVDDLKKAGHRIELATFTSGGEPIVKDIANAVAVGPPAAPAPAEEGAPADKAPKK